MLKHFFYLFSIILLSAPVTAQNNNYDEDIVALRQEANQHYDNFEYDKALDLSSQFMYKAERANDTLSILYGYNLVGSIYGSIKDTMQARLNYEKALVFAKHVKNDSILSITYNNLGNIESSNKKNYEKGINYFKKSVTFNNRSGREKRNMIAYVNIAWTYLDENENKKAIPYLEQAEDLLKTDSDNTVGEIFIKTLKGRYYLKMQNYQMAKSYLQDALVLVKKIGMHTKSIDTYKYLAQVEEALGNYKEANRLINEQLKFESEKYEEARLSETQIASAKFKIDQYKSDLKKSKDKQRISDELVEKSKLLNIIFILALMVLLMATLITLKANKARKKLVKTLHLKNTLLQQSNDETERLSKIQTQFLSTISHELRTPLYGVIGISSLISEENTNPELNADLDSLKFSADYLLALINDVLLMNKMDANGIKIQKRPYKLSDLILNISRSFEYSLSQNNNKIHLSIDQNIPNNLIGDAVRLSQILMNLIGNAIKFNSDGNIWVTIALIENISTNKHMAKFSIKDDGVGIPKNKQKSIFEEFSQVDNKNYSYQGTGLGLPIVKKLLTLFGSEILLESTLGKGTTFWFEMELISNTKQSLIENNKVIETAQLANKITKLLVVDDNRINQRITTKILDKHNFTYMTANNGDMAIEIAKEHKFDLILMDIYMPKTDGIKATQEIRKFDKLTPIIAFTALELDEERNKILECGMNDIILKPFDIDQFTNTILKYIKT